MQFTSDIAGSVVKIRFDKPATASGGHTGHLWDGSGNLLGTVAFTNETASGWQEATLATPVAISASTPYVVSYSETGDFSFTIDYFDSGKDMPPLHVPAGGGTYGAVGTFPSSSYANSSYWVDVVVAAGGGGSSASAGSGASSSSGSSSSGGGAGGASSGSTGGAGGGDGGV
jgi:hypothetical protein